MEESIDLKDGNILKELQAVREWLNHPSVGERLAEAGISAMLTTANKYGECEATGYGTPSGLEGMAECLISSGVDNLNEDQCCTFISEIIDFIGNYFDFDEDDENDSDDGEEPA